MKQQFTCFLLSDLPNIGDPVTIVFSKALLLLAVLGLFWVGAVRWDDAWTASGKERPAIRSESCGLFNAIYVSMIDSQQKFTCIL